MSEAMIAIWKVKKKTHQRQIDSSSAAYLASSRHFVDVSCDCVWPKRNEMEEKIQEGGGGE